MTVYTGNVKGKKKAYAPRSSILQVIDEAVNAEFPGGVATRFIDRNGVFVFHGRLSWFDPEGISAANPGTWDFHTWKIGDGVAWNADPDVAVISPLKFNRGKDNLINAALATPEGIKDEDIAGQFDSDTTSLHKYGARSIGFEDLITDGHSDGSTTDLEETKKFSTYWIANYNTPQNRVEQVELRIRDPRSDPKAPAIWDLMCMVDLADAANLTTTHPGGGGFADVPFFVVGVEEEWTPLNKEGVAANSLWHDTTVTLDLAPRSYFTFGFE
jgi:hypothetical protein